VRHAILGAGGVGGLIGAVLAHQGDQVTLLLRPETLGQHPSHLRLEGPFGNFQATVRTDAKLREPADVLWVTVKAYQLVAALRAVPRDGPRIETVVPLLNGIDHVSLLRRSFNHECVVPGTIAVEAERVAPGHIIQRSPFVRLALSATGERQMEGIARRLRHVGFSCEFQTDEKTMLWSKLAFLAPFALATTAGNNCRKDPWDRCAYNSRTDCKNRRPPKALAAYLPTSIVYNARIFCALRSRQE
jgi:2-dehydropantoate 2-reductase